MRRTTKRTPTEAELQKLKGAIEVLRDYCAAGCCPGCPLNADREYPENSCVFGSFYPELWKDLIKEDKK